MATLGEMMRRITGRRAQVKGPGEESDKPGSAASDKSGGPRVYQVPEGLARTVAVLMDQTRGADGHCASILMWRLLERRCPEITEGTWKIYTLGSSIYVEEMTA